MCLAHWVSSHAMVLSLSGQSAARSLPRAKGLGFVIVDVHWPVPRHVQDIVNGSVPVKTIKSKALHIYWNPVVYSVVFQINHLLLCMQPSRGIAEALQISPMLWKLLIAAIISNL